MVPKIYYHDQPEKLWFAGGDFARANGYSGVHVGEGEVDRGQFDRDGAIGYSPTCCMLIAVTVFHRVELMDPKYFVYYDDTDFCFRLSRLGIPIWYASGPTLFHKVGSLTGGQASPFSARMGVRNKVYFLRKHFGVTTVAWFLFAYAGYLELRRISRKDSKDTFRIKVEAFREGLRL